MFRPNQPCNHATIGRGRRAVRLALAGACWAVGSLAGVAADPAAPAPAATETAKAAATADPKLDASRQELHGIESTLSETEAQRRRIVDDLEAIRTDRVRLNAALIETTQKVHDAEAKVATIEARLDTMTGSQDAIRQSLESRRGVIAEVLASLQRMGRKPPPAILVSPDDILKTIRTSMLLGAVVPELHAQAEALASDLGDLQRLRQSISAERDTLTVEVTGLEGEQQRLDGLIAARQAAQAEAETELGDEQGRAADLSRQATTLKDLIARMEGDMASARHAGDAARAADDERHRVAQADAETIRARVAAGPFRDPARLTPAIDFADAKAMLSLPATGQIVKSFGSADEFGGTEKGLSIATRPGAVVSAPTDGWIAFSGPYRTYGQILIINAGGGYYIVLAGMKTVNVAPGQFILAGEPVAAMGDGSVRTAAAISLGAAEPILYVEFRKDGTAVDPTPWWAKAELEKVRG